MNYCLDLEFGKFLQLLFERGHFQQCSVFDLRSFWSWNSAYWRQRLKFAWSRKTSYGTERDFDLGRLDPKKLTAGKCDGFPQQRVFCCYRRLLETLRGLILSENGALGAAFWALASLRTKDRFARTKMALILAH